jgi:glycosyltransferase involved in cell wall biosynthesis
MKLSIGMMVKNEEKYLEQCLNSIMPILDKIDSELVIVDTGSNDRTIEIAKKFTDKIYFHDWNNNFAEMRNITISYCSGEWFFCIDGDEVLEDCTEIINFFDLEEYKKYESAVINVKNLMDLSDSTNYVIYAGLRLFKKDREFRYEGAIHNQPVFKQPTAKLNASIQHFGYIATDKDLMEKKFKRTSEILKKELKENPKDFYYMYLLSVSYAMHGDKEEATLEIEKCYNYIKENKIDLSEHLYVLQQLCISYFNANNYLQVVKYATEWLAYQSNVIDVYYFLGSSKLMLSNDEEAISYLEKYIEIVENSYNNLVDIKTLNYTLGKIDEVHFNLALLYSKIMNNEKAIYYLLKIESNKYNIIQEIVTLCIRNKCYERLYEYYNNLLETEDYNKINEFFLYIEAAKLHLDKIECNNITEIFAKGTSLYARLNNIRINYENNNPDIIEYIKDFIDKEGITNLPDYYGDLIYYLINLKENVSQVLEKVTYKVLNRYLEYITTKYDDFSDKLYEYLKAYEEKEDFKSLKINKELLRYVILLNKLDKKKFQYSFIRYIDTGIKYVNTVYTPFILENEKYQECRNEEDGFFIFMRTASQYEKSDKKLYLHYLSKALEVYPNMKDGIKLLLEEIKEVSNMQNNEIEQYKLQVKNTIKLLIDSGKIEDAEKVINEYDEIVKDDVEMYTFKAVISMLQGRFIEVEKIIKNGLLIDNNNFDLFYNLGYLYDIQNKKIEAVSAYTIAKILCKDDNFKGLIEENISRISEKKPNIYNVVLYGTLEQCVNLKEMFREWNVIGYIIYGNSKVHNEKILSVQKIATYNYDFIFIADESNENSILEELMKYGVDRNIYSYSMFKMSVIEGFDYRIKELLYADGIEMLITGSSYAEVGIKVEELNTSAINFAFSSQDLFYDYEIINYLLNYQNIKNSIKYVILGLSYYYFDYDMSKSIAKYRVHRYTDYIDNLHYNNDIIGVNLTKVFYNTRLGFNDYYEMNKMKENAIVKYKDKDQEYVAQRNSSMNYNVTREENIDIFSKYLNLLKANNIKPIIVICPTSKYYNKYFQDGYQKNKFYRIINDFKNKYDFQIIDYFDSDLFEDGDFWDYGHLNGRGTKKFTNIINKEIKW